MYFIISVLLTALCLSVPLNGPESGQNLLLWLLSVRTVISSDREHIYIYIYPAEVWQKLCADRVAAVTLTYLTSQKNMFPQNFSVITSPNSPARLCSLCCSCINPNRLNRIQTHFHAFSSHRAVFSFKLNNFRDFIIAHIERVSGAGLHQPIIYSLTWIFQTVAHRSLSRCWVPSRAALIRTDTGPDVWKEILNPWLTLCCELLASGAFN